MKQRVNENGILNVRVSRAVLQVVKAKAEADGRTLQWTVEQALIGYLQGSRPAATDEVPRPKITPREFIFRRCKVVLVPDGYDNSGVMRDPETGQYWAVIAGKAQGDWCETQQEAEERLDLALGA